MTTTNNSTAIQSTANMFKQCKNVKWYSTNTNENHFLNYSRKTTNRALFWHLLNYDNSRTSMHNAAQSTIIKLH